MASSTAAYYISKFLYHNTAQAESNESILNYLKVSGVIEDENNYIWFSGQSGLARFDGTDLIHFSNNNEKWNIPYTWIFDVIKDGDDFIVTTSTLKYGDLTLEQLKQSN